MLAWGRAGRVLAGVAALAVVAVIGYRVLAPTETLDRAEGPYPPRVEAPFLRIGVLTSAPLIVDNRIRVYAEKRRVWADTPVDSKTQASPYWAYRRWPAQVVGVVAVESVPVVVTRWSDGALVALDPRTGRIAWRATGPAPDVAHYTGRRTGSSTVYEPDGLYTVRDRALVVAYGNRTATGYDAATGRPLWTEGDACDGWTGATVYVSSCGGAVTLYDAGTGRRLLSRQLPAATPWGCALGRSGCELMEARAGDGQATEWRLGSDGGIAPEPYARTAMDVVLGDAIVESIPDRYVALVDRRTGNRRWTAPLPGYVIGADARGVYVVTRRFNLTVLDPRTGLEIARLGLRGTDTRDWNAGHVYLHDGYIAIERLTGRPRDVDDRYFYGATPVVLAGS
jgi:outer membrane protein assembly factor BamB